MPNIRPLNAALAKKAQTELFEEPGRIDGDLEILREWIKKQRHLTCRDDDQFLVLFLRGSKYSLERTKEKFDTYFTARALMTEFFIGRDPNANPIAQIIKLGVQLPLPLTDGEDGPRIMLIRPGVYSADQFNIKDVMIAGMMINDILMEEDDNLSVAGQVGILDLSNVTMAHFLQFNPQFIKKMTFLSQEASPLRQKGFHYVHTPSGFETIFNLFKSFMSEKNKSRVSKFKFNFKIIEISYNFPERVFDLYFYTDTIYEFTRITCESNA